MHTQARSRPTTSFLSSSSLLLLRWWEFSVALVAFLAGTLWTQWHAAGSGELLFAVDKNGCSSSLSSSSSLSLILTTSPKSTCPINGNNKDRDDEKQSIKPARYTTQQELSTLGIQNVLLQLGIPVQPNASYKILTTSTSTVCDQAHVLFLNKQDASTCLAILSFSNSNNNKSMFLSSRQDGRRHHVAHFQQQSSPQTQTQTPNLMLALSRHGHQNLRLRQIVTKTNSMGFEYYDYQPVPWYYDHSHKPPWRLSSPPKPVITQDTWWPLLRHYLSILPQARLAWQSFVSSSLSSSSSSSRSSPHNNESNCYNNTQTTATTTTTTWIILVTNSHHLDLLRNWACAAAVAGSRLKQRAVVVALDETTHHVASRELQLNTFYYPSLLPPPSLTLLAKMTAEYATREYGYVMVLAKVFVVHLLVTTTTTTTTTVNTAGATTNFLFHDVDIVPLRDDYVEYLEQKGKQYQVDMIFQYDFFEESSRRQTPPEYAPWFLNSGLYWVQTTSSQNPHRRNHRVQAFVEDWLRHGDYVLRSSSHQAVVSWLLSSHVSRQHRHQKQDDGLRVHILHQRKESDLFPGGYHFHHKWDYMHQLIAGQLPHKPYLFHMNYNDKKATKIQFLQQMGWWYLAPVVDAKNNNQNNNGTDQSSSSGHNNSICVTVPPTPKPICHYRDKPSVSSSCRTFPAVESGQSFW